MSLIEGSSPRISWIALSSLGIAFLLGSYYKRQRLLKRKQIISKKQRRDAIISWDFSKLDSVNKPNEFVVFDLETTIPATDIIEFGAIVLDKFSFQEKARFETLVYSTKITKRSTDCNHITIQMVKDAPFFKNIADQIYELLNGRIWVGHNITRFDKKVIEDSFKAIGKQAPTPFAMIDTLPLLKNSIGDRYGNLKLATLGNFFGLGEEEHRSLSDCEMNIQVLKNCALTVFIESYCNINLVPDLPKPQKKIANNSPHHHNNNNTNNNNNTKISPSKGSSPALRASPSTSPSTSKPKGLKSQKPKPNAIIIPSKSNPDTSNNNNMNTENELPASINPEIHKQVKKAIEDKSVLTIFYSGGHNRNSPRKISPLKIKKTTDADILITALCHTSNTEKNFSVSKIAQIL